MRMVFEVLAQVSFTNCLIELPAMERERVPSSRVCQAGTCLGFSMVFEVLGASS